MTAGGGLTIASRGKCRWVGRAGILPARPHLPQWTRYLALTVSFLGLQLVWSCEMSRVRAIFISLQPLQSPMIPLKGSRAMAASRARNPLDYSFSQADLQFLLASGRPLPPLARDQQEYDVGRLSRRTFVGPHRPTPRRRPLGRLQVTPRQAEAVHHCRLRLDELVRHDARVE